MFASRTGCLLPQLHCCVACWIWTSRAASACTKCSGRRKSASDLPRRCLRCPLQGQWQGTRGGGGEGEGERCSLLFLSHTYVFCAFSSIPNACAPLSLLCPLTHRMWGDLMRLVRWCTTTLERDLETKVPFPPGNQYHGTQRSLHLSLQPAPHLVLQLSIPCASSLCNDPSCCRPHARNTRANATRVRMRL